MKKFILAVSYDAGKMDALQKYMSEKNKTLEPEIVKLLDSQYRKYVPAEVRAFLTMGNSRFKPPGGDGA